MVPAKTDEEVVQIAERLRVSPQILRDGVDGRSRLAAIKVIEALVVRGIDAKWMLTGEVDPALHRRMLNAAPQDVHEMMKRLISDASAGNDQGRDSSWPH